jgi:glycosyl hydrolase family 18 (putative chitinase)
MASFSRSRARSIGSATLLVMATIALSPSAASAATPLPSHVYAPYFETWTTDSLTAVSQQSGVRHFTLAFLETLSKSSCTLAWNGSKSQTVASGRYLTEITALRAAGGDVIPSLGGWSADQGGTEIGDSCKTVSSIVAAYQELVNVYGVSRIDMDIEGRSLTNTAGIDRRNKAIAQLQAWATAQGKPLTISYTLPTSASGLEASGVAVLQNAVDNGVRIDFVEPMVFDYYDKVTTDMGSAAIAALQGLHGQLHTLLPSKSDAQLWAIEGATIMNGIDDYPKKTEVTTLAHAQQLRDFAVANGLGSLSMWAIQRDNGSCPGVGGANDCSGIAQSTWAFSAILKTFTGG